MPIITSTLSCSQDYTLYRPSAAGDKGMPILVGVVRVNGGANCIDKHFITRDGVVTTVTDEQLELLEKNPDFARHKENGFIKVAKIKAVSVKSMKKKDKSAQLTESDFDKSPVVKSSEE